MYERILVAYDGSATSRAALTHAIRLADICGAELRVLHVLDATSPFGLGASYVPADLLDAWRGDARRLLKDADEQARIAGVACETDLMQLASLNDDIASGIARDAAACGARLVVIGTHGRRGMRRALLGSVAERVARQAPCAVLLVRVGDEPADAPGESNGESTESGG
ncbi:universal stress protein [Paraburkholderia sp. J94]|uniref:universal stress protein n=1 Tax=Paraburkholderia sp. J94 TaxID=2805441 RepID=UPI002AAFE368|nr:universal stress protein [Paraburkholderia sp. J94]